MWSYSKWKRNFYDRLVKPKFDQQLNPIKKTICPVFIMIVLKKSWAFYFPLWNCKSPILQLNRTQIWKGKNSPLTLEWFDYKVQSGEDRVRSKWGMYCVGNVRGGLDKSWWLYICIFCICDVITCFFSATRPFLQSSE